MRGQDLLGLERLVQDRARSQQMDAATVDLGRSVSVQPPQDSLVHALGSRSLDPVLVVEGQVVEDVLALRVHAADSLANDDRQLVGVGRVIGEHVGQGGC